MMIERRGSRSCLRVERSSEVRGSKLGSKRVPAEVGPIILSYMHMRCLMRAVEFRVVSSSTSLRVKRWSSGKS